MTRKELGRMAHEIDVRLRSGMDAGRPDFELAPLRDQKRAIEAKIRELRGGPPSPQLSLRTRLDDALSALEGITKANDDAERDARLAHAVQLLSREELLRSQK